MHIEARNLVKKFKEHTAVDRVSLRVEKGEIVGLLGPNGAGKTTSFYMIVGLEQPTSGEVYLSDVNISDMPMYQRAALGISYLTQEASIFRKLTVEQNILAILETTRLSKAEQYDKYEELLAEFHIEHVRNRKGTELSGGSGAGLRLPAAWRLSRSLSYWMSPLPVSTHWPWQTYRILFSICGSAAWGY